MGIGPPLGSGRPTRTRRSVLLPEPEPPRMTRVSPRWTSRSMPWRTSRSPNCTRRSRTEMTVSGSRSGAALRGGICSFIFMRDRPDFISIEPGRVGLPGKGDRDAPTNIVGVNAKRETPQAVSYQRDSKRSSSSQNVKHGRENKIHGDDKKNGCNDRGSRRAAHLLGAGSGAEPFVAPHCGNRTAKDNAFDQARGDVAKLESIEGREKIAAEGEACARDTEERAAENAHGVGPRGQTGKHERHGKEFGHDEKLDGIERHGFQGVDFLGDLHGADFGRKCRAGAANDDNRGDERAKFARHGDGHGARDVVQGAEFAQLVGALEREDHADEKRNQRENGKGLDPDGHGLMHGALETHRLAAERRNESIVGGAQAEPGQPSQIGEAGERRAADAYGEFQEPSGRCDQTASGLSPNGSKRAFKRSAPVPHFPARRRASTRESVRAPREPCGLVPRESAASRLRGTP